MRSRVSATSRAALAPAEPDRRTTRDQLHPRTTGVLSLTTIHYGNLRFCVEDTDVLLRLREPDLNMLVTYLKADEKTTGEDVLYKCDYLDNQWFVIVNYPLLQEQIENAVEIYAEERGFEEARYIPMENLVYCTLRDLCEAIDPHECEESA